MTSQQADPAFVLNFFTEELTSDNVHHRLFAANNIALVAASIGHERARTDLMNFLLTANQFEGEVQMVLAGCLGKLVKYVGGPEHAHVLLGPLKVLASAEELVVRNKAMESMGVVCNSIPPDNSDSSLMSTARDLATADFFTSRSSACPFIVKIYPKVNDQNKADLCHIYKTLARDGTPMVRRSAFKHLPQLCEVIPPNIIVSEVAKDILTPCVNDDEDSVRLLLPASLSVISSRLKDEERHNLIVVLGKVIVKDSSWRVRSSFALELPTIAKSFSDNVIMDEICPFLFRLLRDPEAETKTAACKALSGILPLLSKQESFVSEKIIPEASTLTNDSAPQVRREIASHLMEFAPIIGNHNTSASIVPIFQQILHDNDNDASAALLKSLLQHVDSIDLATITPAILPVILEISGETHWRVKVVIIELLPSFTKVLDADDFNKKIFPLIKVWLSDLIYSVRKVMTETLPSIVKILGVDWAVNTLAPVIIGFKSDRNYLIRQVTLLSIQCLHGTIPDSQFAKTFLPVILQMASDPIPNVKSMSAKSLILFTGINDQKVTQQIQSTLKTLSSDHDQDVKYFACMALLKCQ